MTMKRKREAKDRTSGAVPATQAAVKTKRHTPATAAATAAPKPILKKTKTTAPAAPGPQKPDTTSQQPPAKKAKKADASPGPAPAPVAAPATSDAVVVLDDAPATLQIVAGSYDRALLGVTATISRSSGIGSGSGSETAHFANTFLFNAHTSAIRCLALSAPSVPVPGQGQKIMLATGSTDERINIYHLSAHPPAAVAAAVAAARRAGGGADEAEEERALMASLGAVMPTAENTRNRELGTLLHHASTITRLVFPTRSKLLSASEDSTIAVTRTRDWSLLSTIRAPVPKAGTGASAQRPSGDTAAPGAAPSGINDFAVHPSMKVMLSVSRGERCMRLWNLVTGKKAGVLNFGRELLRDLGEGRHATGEGRQVVWGRSFGGGDDDKTASDEYAIGFDRNVVVFGMDSLPRCKVLGDARTKTHDFQYVEVDAADGQDAADGKATDEPFSLLAVATEDGRVLLCSTRAADVVEAPAAATAAAAAAADSKKAPAAAPLPCARLVGVIGGQAAGVTGRVKAFKMLPAMEAVAGTGTAERRLHKVWYVVTASSAGALRVWKLTSEELRAAWANSRPIFASSSSSSNSKDTAPTQLGQLLGTYQTQDRITCVEAFVMLPRPEGLEDDEFAVDEGDEDDDDEDEDDEDDE